jgi:hypothetical protein
MFSQLLSQVSFSGATWSTQNDPPVFEEQRDVPLDYGLRDQCLKRQGVDTVLPCTYKSIKYWIIQQLQASENYTHKCKSMEKYYCELSNFCGGLILNSFIFRHQETHKCISSPKQWNSVNIFCSYALHMHNLCIIHHQVLCIFISFLKVPFKQIPICIVSPTR